MSTVAGTVSPLGQHAAPLHVTWPIDAAPLCNERLAADEPLEHLVHLAGRATRCLPAPVHDALVDFLDAPHPSGALLISAAPIGSPGTTPPSPTAPGARWARAELSLLTVARRLGQPVGYLPEHGGDVVQQIVPVRASSHRQVSTSSRVELMFHTEAAFHPHRPRYLVLLCLRGDPAALTTLSSIHEVVGRLPDPVVDVLFQPRFRTAVDESYLHGRANVLGAPMPVLTGRRDVPSMVFDADLMVGVDRTADDALGTLAAAVRAHQTAVSLCAGDLLVIDNRVAVHGRSPFQPRFDGTDRWLQRAFVVSDLAPSAAERSGRVITTQFGV